MTFATDLAKDDHNIGYYVQIAGIETRFATHDMAAYGLAGTYEACIPLESLSGGESQLDREASVVTTSGFSFAAMDTATVRGIVRRRGGVETTLNGALTTSATSITLASGTNTYPDGTTIHLDKEAVNLTTHGGSGVYTCVRGAHGTLAARHLTGAAISDVPRHWLGRDVQLVLVHLDTGNAQSIRWGYLSASPRFDAGRWEFQAADRLGTLLNRPLFTGFEEVQALSQSIVSDSSFTGYSGNVNVIQIDVPNAAKFVGGFVRLTADTGSFIFRLNSAEIDTGADTLKVAIDDYAGGDALPNWLGFFWTETVTVSQFVILEGTPGELALKVLLSDQGDGANDATWDVLEGVDTTPGVQPVRIGAAVAAAYVDKDSWLDAGDTVLRVPVDEEITVGDFLARECLWRAGGFAYLDSAGKLAFKRYTPGIRSAATSLGDGELLAIASTDDEEGVVSRVSIECNYDPMTRQYHRKIDYVYDDTAPIYRDRATAIAFKCKHLWIGQPLRGEETGAIRTAPIPANPAEVQAYFDRIRYRINEDSRRFEFDVAASSWADVDEGDRTNISSSYHIDHRGNATLSGVVGEVTGRTIDYQTGKISASADEINRGWLVAPSAHLSSWSSGSNTLNLSSGGVLGAGTMFDIFSGLDFAADWYVRIFHASADYGTSERVQVSSTAINSIVLTGAPTTTPAAGDIVVLDFSDDSGNTVADGSDVLDYAFCADSSLEVSDGTTTVNGPRYG